MDEWLNLSVLTGLDLLGSEVIESEGKGNHTVFHPGQLMTSSKHSTWTEDRDLDAKVLLTFSRVYSLSQESIIPFRLINQVRSSHTEAVFGLISRAQRNDSRCVVLHVGLLQAGKSCRISLGQNI